LSINEIERLRAEYLQRDAAAATRRKYAPFEMANLFTVQCRARHVLKALGRQRLDWIAEQEILELGCGRGGVLLEYLGYGASPERLHGTDLLPSRVQAAHRLIPNVPITCADGQRLPYKTGSFDLVLQYTVLSSVLDCEVKANMAREMLRVLRVPGGRILWYDFWLNPTNPQTRGIRLAEVRKLFPACHLKVRRITLALPIARWLVPVSWHLSSLLESIKIFNTHYLIVIRPQTSRAAELS
jgi:SAM-dependent methyltransferase